VLLLNPLPLTTSCEMVKVAVPLLESCMLWLFVKPITTSPKLALEGVIVRAGPAAAEPVPLSGTLIDGFVGSLLAITIVPVAEPAAVGENVTVS